MRSQLGLGSDSKRYRETAVVAHFRCERPAAGVARQWFRSDGILAWLPLPGERMSIVWSARDELADELAALEPEELASGAYVTQAAPRWAIWPSIPRWRASRFA